MLRIDIGLAESISSQILEKATTAKSEADIQIEVEHILRNFFDMIGVDYEPHHNITVVKGRPDTLYGRAIIEYKEPGTLRSKAKTIKAVKEAQDRIKESALQNHENSSKYMGIVLDGEQITFTKFRRNNWIEEPVSNVNSGTIQKMLEYLNGLALRPLHPDFLVQDFGPKSYIGKKAVRILYQSLNKNNNARVDVIYKEWHKTFNQVCGYDFMSAKLDIQELLTLYDINNVAIQDLDFAKLLFAIHTYYALVIKFLAAEIAVLYASPISRSYLDDLNGTNATTLKSKLQNLEDGYIFADLGIRNFLEGDFFGWYLDNWDENIRHIVMEVVKKLLEYEPSTTSLEPQNVRDLLKKLYQYLLPRKIRHDLGEFFTPDWLAEHVLDEASYTGNPVKRILDPACGSGTFLVLIIKRIKEFSQDKMLDKSMLLNNILRNVVGFDLNPLALIASRTNYLIALGELLRYRKTDIHIPVYLCDSISVSSRNTLLGEIYDVTTSVGQFTIPSNIVTEKIIDSIFSMIDSCIKNQYLSSEFMERLHSEISNISESSSDLLEKMYEGLLQLEIKGINRIWARVIKNSFAPFFSGIFDYVIGNPPWINWENLPEDYRIRTKSLWVEHKLIKGSLSGAFKKDIAMLFVSISINRFLKEDGVLVFLLPFPLLKTQSAAGYRVLLANNCKIELVDEMVTLKPFENAINRPSLVVLKKGRTEFPIKGNRWFKLDHAELNYELSLEQIKRKTGRERMILEPIEGKSKPESPWIMINKKLINEFRKVTGGSQYHAHSGVDTGLNGAFWVDIISKEPTGVLVKNLYNIGKQKLPNFDLVIEDQNLYPLIRGRDVKKWVANPSCHIVLLHNKDGGSITESTAKRKFPKTYSYFLRFRRQLKNRSTYKLMGRQGPFYSAFKISNYTFSPYKVVWKEISGKISGKGQFIATVISPSSSVKNETLPIIPDHKLIFIPLENGDEAYFVCGVLNSSVVSLVIASYTIETEIPTNIPQYVRIPQYDPSDNTHLKIVELSRLSHSLASLNKESELIKIEQQLDELSCKIYNLQVSTLPIIQDSLREIHS